MIRLFEKIILIVFIVLVGFNGSSFAQSINLFDYDIEILKSDESGVILRYNPPKHKYTPVGQPDLSFYKLDIENTARVTETGRPMVPVKLVPLAIPPKASARITVLQSSYIVPNNKKLAPYFISETKEDFDLALTNFLATDLKQINQTPYIAASDVIRGLKIVKIAIPTASYNSSTNDISVLEEIIINVEFVGGDIGLSAGFRNPGRTFDILLEKMVANYDTGKNWFEPRKTESLTLDIAGSPFDSAMTWVKMELISEGIYKLGWNEIYAVDLDPLSINPDDVRIFYGGGKELPVPNSEPRPALEEIPITILGGDDGQFDNGDYIVFYADAVDTWEYSEDDNRYKYIKNHYTNKNVYWLAINGSFSEPPKRMSNVNGMPSGSFDISVDSYRARVHKEIDRIFYVRAGGFTYTNHFEWYWQFGRSLITTSQLSDVVAGDSATVIIRHRLGYPSLQVNNGPELEPETGIFQSKFQTTSLSSGLNNLNFTSSIDYYADYIDIHYDRWLNISDGSLLFSQPDLSGIIRYNLTNAQSPNMLLDITDVNNPILLNDAEIADGNMIFHDSVSLGENKQYYYALNSRFKSPSSLAIYEIDDLRDISLEQNSADQIIITYDSYFDHAERLAEVRENEYGLRTRVVKISDIYNQFSWGLFDAVAIRDFLKYAYENWTAPAPSFVLLFGDGHYDYRNNLNFNSPQRIPPFENDLTMSDEHYIYFGNYGYFDSDSNSVPDMIIGRVPANSNQDAEELVDKIIGYDLEPNLGSWRNRIVIVADDNISTPNYVGETLHTNQAESLSNLHVPNEFELNKIYLVDYPRRSGGEKPEAREALISAFNQGSLLIEYIGHGGPGLWAHERIFRRSQDLPRLTNGERLPLIYTASCSIGLFDDPAAESFAEELLRNINRGGFSVISATRPVYSYPNIRLNYVVFDELLGSDSVGVGAALYLAKYIRQQSLGYPQTNDRLFVVFGDPSQYLQFPKFDIRFTTAPDSLVALSVGQVAGEITDNSGNLSSDFNGTVWVTVKDGTVERSVVLRDANNVPLSEPNTISFLSPGPTIFYGPVDVNNGQFSTEFFVPKDISYGSNQAKIYAYAENGSYDAVGVADSIIVSGSVPSISDSTGPAIRLFVGEQPFELGSTIVSPNISLVAEIEDEHGINITGQLGHGIVILVDNGDTYEADVTSDFIFDRGEYIRGAVEVVLSNLSEGSHEISIKAWDNFNNSTLVVKQITVVADDGIVLREVMNYPNPVRKGVYSTEFQYCLNSNVNDVNIKIFTESGIKIKTINITTPENLTAGCHQILWDLLDADSDKIGNGIYIYKISAEGIGTDGNLSNDSQTGKLAILR